jgi:hypothetical protein
MLREFSPELIPEEIKVTRGPGERPGRRREAA